MTHTYGLSLASDIDHILSNGQRHRTIRENVSALAEVAYERNNMTAAGYALKAIRLANDAETDDDLDTAERFVQCAKEALLAEIR